jgi:sugar phosphate isomerase/epimerase
MKLSFMTWVCPDWGLQEVLTAAVRYGYDGFEPRTEVGHQHGIEWNTSKQQRELIRRQCADLGVEISCLATSRQYAVVDPHRRQESIELTRRFIELAADLGCPNVRVFGGPTAAPLSPAEAQKLVADALAQLAPEAQQHGVWLCLETHDDYSRADWCAATVRLAAAPYLGIVWDVMHPFTHGQTMRQAFEAVRDLVRHCHVHDAKRPEGEGPWQLTLMGEGDIPHQEAVALLASLDFQGHLSGEYINFLPPQEVLPHEARVLRRYLAEARG